jgi:hypothetical protein
MKRTFDWMDRHWPTERGWVTILLAVLIGSLLKMADHNPQLWNVEVFKVIIQAAILTGALNMVLAFHFAANKGDETRGQNTGKLAEAIRSMADSANDSSASATGKPEDPVHVVDEGQPEA